MINLQQFVPVHAALLPGGKVLMSDGQLTRGTDGVVWNTATNQLTQADAPYNIFCGTGEQMKDGRIIMVGGHQGAHYGSTNTLMFDPATGQWSSFANMYYPRWYPSVIQLGDGRFLAVGGETNCDGCNVDTPEVYDTALDVWTKLTTATFVFEYYPHLFLLPNGRVLAAATARAPLVSQILTLGTTPSWSAIGGAAVDGGSSVMYLPGKILKTGTSVDPDKTARASTTTAYALDALAASPTWRAVEAMKFARAYHSLTVLPDGSVLVTGGGTTTAPTAVASAVLAPELWSPVTEKWTTLASMSAPRLYHSEALLLPDGRVAVMGGGRFDDVVAPTDQPTAQIFSPPYLGYGPRPRITSAPAALTYGQAFTVQTPDAARVASVSLIRFGAVTHSFDAAQRYLPLTFTKGAGTLSVTAPVDVNLAPGGNYMLFLVDTAGVPSIAAETRL